MKSETKSFFIFLGVILAVFAIIIGIRYVFETQNKTIHELITENYDKKPTERNYIYNGFSFIKKKDPVAGTDYWYTEYQKGVTIFSVPMQYGPKELEYIPLIVVNRSNVSLEKVYITIIPFEDKPVPYMAQSSYEITEKLVKMMGIIPEAACTVNETDACMDRPIINCDNTKDAVVIELVDSEQTAVMLNENCIIVSGKEIEMLKAANKLIYLFLKVVN